MFKKREKHFNGIPLIFFGYVYLFFYLGPLHAVTLVYSVVRNSSLRSSAQALKQEISKASASLLPIFFSRKAHITDPINDPTLDVFQETKIGGVLFDARYHTKNWWIDGMTGLEHDSSLFTGSQTFSPTRIGFDDVVITGGYNYFLKNTQLCLLGLAGFPTRKKVTLDDQFGPLVGSRFYHLALGGFAAYQFQNRWLQNWDIFILNRCMHLFPRSFFPVAPLDATVHPGNEIDTLCALQYYKGLSNFEIGYNFVAYTNEFTQLQRSQLVVPTFFRHAFFLVGSYGFHTSYFKEPTVLGAGMDYSKIGRFDASTLAIWLRLTQVF